VIFLVFIFISCASYLVVSVNLIIVWSMLKLGACDYCQADYEMKCRHEVPWVNNDNVGMWIIREVMIWNVAQGAVSKWWWYWHVSYLSGCDREIGTRCHGNMKVGWDPHFMIMKWSVTWWLLFEIYLFERYFFDRSIFEIYLLESIISRRLLLEKHIGGRFISEGLH